MRNLWGAPKMRDRKSSGQSSPGLFAGCDMPTRNTLCKVTRSVGGQAVQQTSKMFQLFFRPAISEDVSCLLRKGGACLTDSFKASFRQYYE
jgi:hypothetical protein